MRIYPAAIAICLTTSAAWAQVPENVPAPVKEAIAENIRACEPEKASLKAGFVTNKDVNGDGVDDYVLDYEHYVCGDNPSYFCGTGGCLIQVFASVRGRYVKAFDENVRRFAFKTLKGRPAMVLDLHGSACGRVGAAPCRRTLYWNGKEFKAR